ncbi:2-amino-4-hydroxy-6-hydroxymethyldihydropteridine diphosphokinase [Acetomicrobium sp. S15 = DSM 107314]|uniref:2-amino-4-hydroxy-6- hydroxymethyldihydropteridine diphosphokinase n=1 Tax=Acetomicrobium sp. S15 = DSM 107314 TaxID=2529858 RepID=UPI0018E1C549|nr:2-amino-4-hydroxy-6-hydroxymethyldihydropteridine diphosphokinase [Acetomicrobium sp. S15 = DSM 107314]
MRVAAIGLGSNVGDRLGALRRALSLLKRKGVEILRKSDVFETPPVGLTEQPRFLNACVLVKTSMDPQLLLAQLKEMEVAIGRQDRGPWGPREIDLDILYIDDLAIRDGELEIPHPRMHERAFVLLPLSQIAPNWRHPILGKTVEELLTEVSLSGIIYITTL